MEDVQQAEQLAELARVCASVTDIDELVGRSLPLLRSLAGADSATVCRRTGEDWWVAGHSGRELDAGGFDELTVEEAAELLHLNVPEAWAEHGVRRVAVRRRPDDPGYLVLTWSSAAAVTRDHLDVAFACLDGAGARLRALHRYSDLVNRGNQSQRLANMGDYDWHIPTDTNRWSDQLFRIYGYEPGEIEPTYEFFLDHVHPGDRERVAAIHREAHATGEPFEMIERIVRPDGQTRFLSSNGQVVMDPSGTPVRFRGICLDITDQVLAERAQERSATRFRGLVESSPDAILVLDPTGRILHANHRAHELLDGDPFGHSFDEVLAGPVQPGEGLKAMSLTGQPLQLDITTASLSGTDDEGVVAVFLHDAGVRLANEAVAARLREAQVRRRQALEINDNVVQALSAAAVALEQGDVEASTIHVDRTLTAARQMMNDLLDQLDGEDLQPGDLVRAAPSLSTEGAPTGTGHESATHPELPRILIADDDEDIRALVRIKLETSGGYHVLGEAGDGEEAVRMAAELQPDLVLLDLAMPRMDGLQALPLIREAVAGVRVIVLSGFDAHTMASKARAAGADDYLEKGRAIGQLTSVVDGVLGGR